MKDVHTEHCCVLHGCKYNDDDCTVVTKKAPQSYDCEICESTGLTLDDQLRRNEWLEEMKEHRFKHMIYCGKDVTLADVERWMKMR